MAISQDTPASTATRSPSYGTSSSPTPKKLHGRAFYESIGSPKFILAPMVDQSEFAWRMLTRSFMPPSSPQDLLAYTPMLHARMFSETPKFRDAHFQPLRTSLVSPSSPNSPAPTPETLFLDGNPKIDRPLFVQFCANNPNELLSAAKYVSPYCDAVDLNLGCPQGIARKGKYGAFLQEDQELIFSLINKLHLELDVPITAKIRILDTKERTLEYAKMVLRAGASILTVHGRTREMKGHKTGLADWGVIRYLREQLPQDTVLFANGNILCRGDIDRCHAETGVDGVMSAEGNLYDPSIFAQAPEVGQEGREYWRGRDGKGGWRMDAVFRRYMEIIHKYVLESPAPERKPLWLPSDPDPSPNPETIEDDEDEQPPKKKQKTEKREKATSPNLLSMQAHLFHLLRPLVAKHHPIRDKLARARAGDIKVFEEVLTMVEGACREGIAEYDSTGGESWEREMESDGRLKEGLAGKGEKGEKEEGKGKLDESSVETVRKCKRPWWVVQPYVRPLPKEALAKGSLTLSRKERAVLENGGGKKGVEESAKQDVVEVGKVVVEKVGEGVERDEVEIPKEGFVCG